MALLILGLMAALVFAIIPDHHGSPRRVTDLMNMNRAKGREGAAAHLSRLVTAMIHYLSMPLRNTALFSQAILRHGAESPAKPGVHWFKSETMAKALKVEVREINGELTIWWPTYDKPIIHLKGRWQSVPPST
jgi:hypothetical protein